MNAMESPAAQLDATGVGSSSGCVTAPKEYQRPQLIVYGSLSELTRFVGNDDPDAGSVGTVVTT